MKQFLFYLTTMIFMTTGSLKAQNNPFENDAKTIDALMKLDLAAGVDVQISVE